MFATFRLAGGLRRALCVLALGAVPVAASAEVAGDLTYVHCRDSGGDFRISELNHSVTYFSDRFQEYRPVCRDCEVTAWGETITMRDGNKTVVQIDRLAGRIWIRRGDAKETPGFYDARSFQGVCTKGTPVVPRKTGTATARAF